MKRLMYLLPTFFLLQCGSAENGSPSNAAPEGNTSGIDYAQWVNPFVGTGGHGHTFPGATRPFGMVQLSPDTRLDGWDGCSGYHFTDTLLYGFSHTHLSGTGVSDYGDILITPIAGKVNYLPTLAGSHYMGYATPLDKSTELAQPGYYSVHLPDYDILAEMTTTPRVGLHRYTFKKDEQKAIFIDLRHRDKLLGHHLEQVDDHTITGHRISQEWAQEQHVYFHLEFSEPIAGSKLIAGEGIGAFVFDLEHGQPLLVKVGISAVDAEGAKKNLESELDHWDFDKVRGESRAEWNKVLAQVDVQGGSETERTNFYTALYHSYIHPNLFSDVDGRYRGTDLKVHQGEKGKDIFTVFSLWDTFRATHPLYTILEPDRTNDFINTFLNQHDQGGKLPIWELAGNYTGCMIGYHSVPVIADAYMKGIRGFDENAALDAMVSRATRDELGIPQYRQNGFVPSDEEPESVSKTLEYAYDDWCIGMMARAMGNSEVADEYLHRSQYYRNLYDPATGFMRARLNGAFVEPFDPSEVNFHYTEANSWQYSYFVPHDIRGLSNLMGGDDKLEAALDALFSANSETTGRDQADITGLIGQYAHGNEPSHHMAYLYNYTGQPWKTQSMVRQIMAEMYSPAPDGLSGNEDCGQMSSWYVFSALGFYPVCPGSVQYAIGSPLFPESSVYLKNGKRFHLIANNASTENKYIQSAKLNGKDWPANWISHEEILNGGTLELEMGPSPSQSWGVAPNDRPSSEVDAPSGFVVSPVIGTAKRTFYDSLSVSIAHPDPGVTVVYTLDGSEPDASSQSYAVPIQLTNTATIKTMAVDGDGHTSPVIETSLLKIPKGRNLSIQGNYAPQYAAGGDLALIDYIQGGPDFRTGNWQGYEGQDVEFIVDLGKAQLVNQISTGFLQDIRSWIFMPKEVVYSISGEGSNFREVARLSSPVPDNEEGSIIRQWEAQVGQLARYVKVSVKNYGLCPDWHLGAGGQTWVFVDEIQVD